MSLLSLLSLSLSPRGLRLLGGRESRHGEGRGRGAGGPRSLSGHAARSFSSAVGGGAADAANHLTAAGRGRAGAGTAAQRLELQRASFG